MITIRMKSEYFHANKNQAWRELREMFPYPSNELQFQMTGDSEPGKSPTYYEITFQNELPPERHSDLMIWKLKYS